MPSKRQASRLGTLPRLTLQSMRRDQPFQRATSLLSWIPGLWQDGWPLDVLISQCWLKWKLRAETQFLAVSSLQLADMNYALCICYKNGIRSLLDLLLTYMASHWLRVCLPLHCALGTMDPGRINTSNKYFCTTQKAHIRVLLSVTS